MSRTDIETRLRAALSAVRPLVPDTEQPPGLVTSARAPRPRARLALIAAAAIAVIIAALVPYFLISRNDNSQPVQSPPRYLMEGDSVYDAMTGRKIDTVESELSIIGPVAAAKDNRTFYVTGRGDVNACSFALVRVRLGDDGQVTNTDVIVDHIANPGLGGVAVSSDGKRVAYAMAARYIKVKAHRECVTRAEPSLRVLDLDTKETRVWPVSDSLIPLSLTWLRDDQTLVFQQETFSGAGALWTLDTDGPTGDPTATGRQITERAVAVDGLGTGSLRDPAGSKDGVIATLGRSTNNGDTFDPRALVRIDPDDGSVSVVDQDIDPDIDRFHFDSTGQYALVSVFRHMRYGRYIDGEVTWLERRIDSYHGDALW